MDPLSITWWSWLIVGLTLMAAELLLSTGFFLFFLGVGGIATALLALLGVLPSFILQGAAFAVISLGCVVLLRKPFVAKFHTAHRNHPVDSLAGQTALALDDIAPDAMGRVELRGSCWSAHNAGSALITSGMRCHVEKVEGLTLHVRI